jgi:hypothetical protein
VVDVGLSRYFYGADDLAEWKESVCALVELGLTDVVRDVLSAESDFCDDAIVWEARRDGDEVVGRELSGGQAQVIPDAIRGCYDDWDSYAGFSWDQLEDVGAWAVQDLAVRFDDAERKQEMLELVFPGKSDSSRVISLARSWKNWEDDRLLASHIAFAFHQLAWEHRLIVHME